MLAVLLALLLSATPAFADPGDIDTSFGDGGVARMSISGEGSAGRPVPSSRPTARW